MASKLDQLVAAPIAAPPFDIMRSAYAELMVTDIAVSERFYVDLLGLVVTLRTDDARAAITRLLTEAAMPHDVADGAVTTRPGASGGVALRFT